MEKMLDIDNLYYNISKRILADGLKLYNLIGIYKIPGKGEFHPIWNLHRVLPTHRI